MHLLEKSQMITFSIQKSCNSQFVVRNVERIVQVSDVVGRVQIVIVDEVRSVGMNKCIEPKSITPARRKILNLHTFVPAVTNSPAL